MQPEIAIVYNQPEACRYDEQGEGSAVQGVLDEVSAVKTALLELNFTPELFPLFPPVERALRAVRTIKASIVFNLFEGFGGEPFTEVDIASALKEMNIPYTGNTPESLALCLDKRLAKQTLLDAGVPTPAFQVFDESSDKNLQLNLPVILKPAMEDASHGVYAENVVYKTETFRQVLKQLLKQTSRQVIVEEFINGREFNATVLGKEVLPVSEIIYTLPDDLPRILTFESKWDTGSLYYKNTQAVCPAKVDSKTESSLKELARQACKACGCRGYARVDMRADDNGKIYVLEVNPNPDISPQAGCARQSLAAGLSYAEFIKIIVEQAIGENMQ